MYNFMHVEFIVVLLGLLRDKIDSFDFLVPIILPDSKANLVRFDA